jgi:hypothetical protein
MDESTTDGESECDSPNRPIRKAFELPPLSPDVPSPIAIKAAEERAAHTTTAPAVQAARNDPNIVLESTDPMAVVYAAAAAAQEVEEASPQRRRRQAANSSALSSLSKEMAGVFAEYGVSVDEGVVLQKSFPGMLGQAQQGRRHSDCMISHQDDITRRHTIARLPTLGLKLPAKYARKKVQVDCLEPVIFEDHETDF